MAGIIDDKRTDEEKALTIGFIVATDKSMSGWGSAPNKSYVACAYRDYEDEKKVEQHFAGRSEMKRVRQVGVDYKPSLREGDHLSIYGFRDFRF